MELLTLNSSYQPQKLVERYNSLIWSERYSKTGDFQLVTTDVERMLDLLPLKSCVTLRESTVPMIVEDHKIEKKAKQAPKLTVTGRSFESVLERRVTFKPGFITVDGNAVPAGIGVQIEFANSPSSAAWYAIRRIIGDNVDRKEELGIDPSASGYGHLLPQIPILTFRDALPMINLTIPADFVAVSSINPTTEQKFEIKPGNLYSVAMELINSNHHGLKAVRPVGGESQIDLEIYNGADLTNTVVFDAKFDQFDDSVYLLSETGSANAAFVITPTTIYEQKKTEASDYPSGLDRRTLMLDFTKEPELDTPEVRRTRALNELYKYNVTALFDGHVADQVAAGYNRDYFLGDIIRLDGEYGLSRNVRVAEFIRSDDSTGMRAYPTFEEVTE